MSAIGHETVLLVHENRVADVGCTFVMAQKEDRGSASFYNHGDTMNKKTRRVRKKHKKAVERQKAKRRTLASKQR